jgi:hypothetical protein
LQGDDLIVSAWMAYDSRSTTGSLQRVESELGSARHDLEKVGNMPHTKEV